MKKEKVLKISQTLGIISATSMGGGLLFSQVAGSLTLNQSASLKIAANNLDDDITSDDDSTIAVNSDEKWIESIKESAEADTIKIFFTRNASLLYQESLIALLYMLDNISESNTDAKQIAYFVDYSVYNSDSRFNFSYIEDNDNVLFVKENKDINSEVSSSNNQTYATSPTNKQFQLIIDYYQNVFNSGKKVDIWAADLTWSSIWSNCKTELSEIFPYINKIYVLSDGNSQTYSFISSYLERRNSDPVTASEAKATWEELVSTTNEAQRLSLINGTSLYDFLQVSDYVTVFHILEYTQSPYWNLDEGVEIYRAYVFNIDYYDMATKLYGSTDTTSMQNYINNYQLFFNIGGQDLNNATLQDFVEVGYEYYDSSKKNIVWIGDNLFANASDNTQLSWNNITDQIWDEIENSFLVLTKKYPPSEYNYFFKHHPSLAIDQQIEFTNKIVSLATSSDNDADNVHPIIFSSFGWELFLSWDGYYQTISDDYIPFFATKYYEDSYGEPQTQLVGLLYSSSSILTTYAYIVNKYGLTDTQAYESINQDNFPIVGTYGIYSKRVYTVDSYDTLYQKNREFIDEIYDPFIEFGYLGDYYSTQTSTKEIFNEYDLNVNGVNYNTLAYLNYSPLIIEICSGIWLLLVIIIFVTIVIVKRKEKLARIKRTEVVHV